MCTVHMKHVCLQTMYSIKLTAYIINVGEKSLFLGLITDFISYLLRCIYINNVYIFMFVTVICNTQETTISQ